MESCGKKGPGQSCTDSAQCLSGYCVDGVCCDGECKGGCRACNLTSALGKCTLIPAGGGDPRGTCPDENVTSCGRNGLCDGFGACQNYPVGSVCANATCDAQANEAHEVSRCDANGACIAGRTRTCALPLQRSQCGATCSGDNQCVSGKICMGNSCGLKPTGSACSSPDGSECESGHCAQGVCCNKVCGESCFSCNLAGSQGVCTAVAAGAADPKGCARASLQVPVERLAHVMVGPLCRLRHRRGVPERDLCGRHQYAYSDEFLQRFGRLQQGKSQYLRRVAPVRGPRVQVYVRRRRRLRCGHLLRERHLHSEKGAGRAGAGTNECATGTCGAEKVCCDQACGEACRSCQAVNTGGENGKCLPKTNGVACNDGNACTKTDTCQAGSCQGTNPVTCTAQDACHVTGGCDPATGQCSNPAASEGTKCNDGNACTQTDACQAGICTD